MPKKLFLLLTLGLLLMGCSAAPEPATVEELPAATPTLTPLPEPTATLASTETAIPEPTTDPSIFGFVSSADAPIGFMLEPIVQVIFEAEMQKRVDSGEIDGFQVEGLSIIPREDGTFFAEIFYAVQADASFWPKDFGTPGDDGWVRTKCTRLDFEMPGDGYYLKNKAICN
jgi:hypothetical protein